MWPKRLGEGGRLPEAGSDFGAPAPDTGPRKVNAPELPPVAPDEGRGLDLMRGRGLDLMRGRGGELGLMLRGLGGDEFE